MQIARIIAVAAFLATGVAQAQSPIPSNYVDDFGLAHSEASAPPARSGPDTQPTLGWSRIGSPFPGNYVDDFSEIAPGSPASGSMVATTSP